MIRSFIINNYLALEFFKVVINMSLAFFCLGFIVNIFEEINFFKDLDVGISLPIMLSALFVPSMIYNMFPFVILLSGIWFFLKIRKTDEIIGMKIAGMSNFSVIIVPSTVSIILGIVFIALINPITSTLIKKYESIRGSYETQQFEYLATINTNGIWIKEKNFGKNFIIRASNLDNQNLIDLTIYEFDYSHNFVKRIDAKSADISSLNWKLNDAKIIDKEGKTVSENRGYSTREMKTKLQRSLAFPFFLLSMVLLSGVFTLGKRSKENNLAYVFIAIITSVLIFYFNDFSAALGKTEKLPIEVSVWMPIVIIFTFGAAGLIHANQK